MKIYTRTGDDGTTGLFGGGRLPKHHIRIDAYGSVDETNSVLGMADAHLRAGTDTDALRDTLALLQRDLFVLGADLATPLDARPTVPRIDDAHIDALEAAIDRYDAELPTLKTFILPGGGLAGATLHLARTVCRRAERLVVALAETETINPRAAVYLNRMSDLLFVLARWTNHRDGAGETPWRPS